MSQLPAGWSLSNLGVLTQTKSGNSKLIKGKLSAEPTGDAPFPAFSASGQDVWTSTPEHSGDAVIVSAVGARCGKAFLASGEWSAIANTHVVWPKPGFLNVRLLWYRINDESFWVKGGSAQPFVKVGATFESPFALPPASEQKRIADKLDTVLTRVDAVNTRLARVAPILKRFRQSVLAAATSGRLTEDWRDGNPNICSWIDCQIGDLLREKPRNGYSPKAVDHETPVRSLTLSATTTGRFRPECFKFVPDNIPPDSHLWISKGDVLIQRANSLEYVGVSAVVDVDLGGYIYPDLMMKCRANERTSPAFLHLLLSSADTRKFFRVHATGTAGNMPKINQQTVIAAPCRLPTSQEQGEIVRRVETLFTFANRLEDRLLTAQTATERLTPALLAKAFRGELVPQDPNDEPASELLRRLQQEAPSTSAKRGRKSAV